MTTAYLAMTLSGVAANGFSGIAELRHFKPILPGMAKADVPESWLAFPIGTLKTLGALGLAAGLALHPLGVAAAIGLVPVLCVRRLHPRPRPTTTAAIRTRDRLSRPQCGRAYPWRRHGLGSRACSLSRSAGSRRSSQSRR